MIRLLELRKERGLSQRNIAKVFNVSQSTYNNWENSNTQPSIEQLVALARFFEVSVDYLIGNSDDIGTITMQPDITAEDKTLLGLFSSLSPAVRSSLTDFLRTVTESPKTPHSF